MGYMRWNIPNILTVIRLFAAPGVAIMFLYFPRPLADWYAMSLFILASVTDFLDGYLARKWHQESNFGAMLDPIADKAMVVIALLVITGLSAGTSQFRTAMDPYILLPAIIILFREVFVSGLREFLGDKASELKVTKLAKWKTTVQMIAISVLFAKGVLEHYAGALTYGMDRAIFEGIMSGEIEDVNNLARYVNGMNISWSAGVILLWIAATLTFITGIDYFKKSLPFLKDNK
jgi:CDP-diacylglycerol--glycerol-3-phosphate 3-phosphatidyltransferase